VTDLYASAPYPHTSRQVLAALLQNPDGRAPGARPVPVGKELRSTIEGEAIAMAWLLEPLVARQTEALLTALEAEAHDPTYTAT
jgi:hypothetical protein